MKKSALFFATLFTLFFCSCLTEESALSDIEITDPELISPTITLFERVNEKNSFSYGIEVWLFDKNKNSVKLKGGKVRINGQLMKLEEFAINKAPFYSGNDLFSGIEPNTTYKFEIEFSDGKVYTASISTPDKELKELNVPENHSKESDMNISWSEAYAYNQMDVGLILFHDSDDGSGLDARSLSVNPNDFLSGEYTISKNNFITEDEQINKARVTLSGVKKGTIDSRFGPNAQIETKFSLSKEVSIK